jgi:hypothetical protein
MEGLRERQPGLVATDTILILLITTILILIIATIVILLLIILLILILTPWGWSQRTRYCPLEPKDPSMYP